MAQRVVLINVATGGTSFPQGASGFYCSLQVLLNHFYAKPSHQRVFFIDSSPSTFLVFPSSITLLWMQGGQEVCCADHVGEIISPYAMFFQLAVAKSQSLS
eukprot:TRINITY_DN7701_c1_g1_i1.p3 TRINITY_DN7701_c1_g1~~TRINITY_DN7701_c1_g1_i1.p3  ORF type:complete len:101 (+),score=10.01 TRINITY_DN7701_c1_g1_i1:347-649(+)